MSKGTMQILKKMTRTKLIEEAKEYPEIVGAHGMDKEQLIEELSKVIKAAGTWIEEEDPKKKKKKNVKDVFDRTAVKKQIKELKKQRDGALAAGDNAAFVKARTTINALKGKLRRTKVVDAV